MRLCVICVLSLAAPAGVLGDPPPEKPAGPGRGFWAAIAAAVTVACLAMLLSAGQLRAPAMFGPYSVSVPLEFRAYDPARWAIMNAGEYAEALKIAGDYDKKKLRDAFYKVSYQGIIANYKPAFEKTAERHDAILPSAYKLLAYHNGILLPVEQTPFALKN